MALKILFGSDVGLLSLLTIGFVVAMAVFYIWFFTRNIQEERKK